MTSETEDCCIVLSSAIDMVMSYQSQMRRRTALYQRLNRLMTSSFAYICPHIIYPLNKTLLHFQYHACISLLVTTDRTTWTARIYGKEEFSAWTGHVLSDAREKNRFVWRSFQRRDNTTIYIQHAKSVTSSVNENFRLKQAFSESEVPNTKRYAIMCQARAFHL